MRSWHFRSPHSQTMWKVSSVSSARLRFSPSTSSLICRNSASLRPIRRLRSSIGLPSRTARVALFRDLACFADLLHDREALVPLDDPPDRLTVHFRDLVSRDHPERVAAAAN